MIYTLIYRKFSVLISLLYRILSVCQALLVESFLYNRGDHMTIYERIESLRNSKNISQGKLERELGFSNGSISKWKNSMPKPERLQKIADYFGVSMEYLMTGETLQELKRPVFNTKDEKDIKKRPRQYYGEDLHWSRWSRIL